MKRSTYYKIGAAIPITICCRGALLHWLEQKPKSRLKQAQIRQVLTYTIENDLLKQNYRIFRFPIDEENLMMAIETYKNDRFFWVALLGGKGLTTKAVEKMIEVCDAEFVLACTRNYLSKDNRVYMTPMVPLLRKYASSEDVYARANVAGNPACPIDVLEKLSRDKAIYVRCCVAKNCIPEELMLKMAEDNGMQVRRALARNSGITVPVIRRLVEYDDWEVNQYILWNENCPADIVEKLASFKCKNFETLSSLRAAIVCHPNLTERAWEILRDDPDPALANIALASKRFCPAEAVTSMFVKTKKHIKYSVECIMRNRDDLTDEAIDEFLNMGAIIRAIVIESCRMLSQKTLKRLSNDKSRQVQRALSLSRISDTDAIMHLFDELGDYCKENPFERCLLSRFTGNLGPGSADSFIKWINENQPPEWERYVRGYIDYSHASEEDRFKVYDEYKDKALDPEWPVRLLFGFVDERELSTKGAETFIEYALDFKYEPYVRFLIQNVRCKGFYDRIILPMLCDYIKATK